MGIAEPAYTSVGPIRVDRRAADRRNSAAALLAAVTSGLAVTRDTIFARQRFEEALRAIVRAKSVTLCDEPGAPPHRAGCDAQPLVLAFFWRWARPPSVTARAAAHWVQSLVATVGAGAWSIWPLSIVSVFVATPSAGTPPE